MRINVALPGLIWPDVGDFNYILNKTQAPHLSKLIKRAILSDFPYHFSDLIYTNHQDLAYALALKLQAAHEFKYFMLAEPTHLRADRDRLLICESELLQLNEYEIDTLIKAINQHFASEIKLYKVNTNLLLLGLNTNIDNIVSYPILDIIGENIDPYLTKNIKLNKILNEIQMLLFNEPLNLLRKQEHLLTINSLWLWNKKTSQQFASQFSTIFTNHRSIMEDNDKIQPLPEDIEKAFTDNSLIIYDTLYYPCCYRDSYGWLDNLINLDSSLGKLLLNKLHKLSELNLIIPGINNGIKLQIKPGYKYKFWHKLTFSDLYRTFHALQP